MTTQDQTLRDPFNAELKILLLSPKIAIATAGSRIVSRRIVEGHQSVPEDQLLSWLLKRIRAEQQLGADAECLVATMVPDAQILRVRNGRVETSARTWIGDQAAFGRYQEALGEVRKRWDTARNFNDDMGQAEHALKMLCECDEYPTVGGLVVSARTWSHGFMYLPRVDLAAAPQTFPEGGALVEWMQGAVRGSYTQYVMAPIDTPGVSQLGIYLHEIGAGVLLDPLQRTEPLKAEGTSIESFGEWLYGETGHRFTGFGGSGHA